MASSTSVGADSPADGQRWRPLFPHPRHSLVCDDTSPPALFRPDSLVRHGIPCGSPRRLVRGVRPYPWRQRPPLPSRGLVHGGRLSRLPIFLAASSVTTSPTAVRADSSAEATIVAVLPWPRPAAAGRAPPRPAVASAATASPWPSARPCPRRRRPPRPSSGLVRGGRPALPLLSSSRNAVPFRGGDDPLRPSRGLVHSDLPDPSSVPLMQPAPPLPEPSREREECPRAPLGVGRRPSAVP